MKRNFVLCLCLLLAAGIAVSGCAKKAATTGTAAATSTALKTEDIPLDEANINFSEPEGIAAFRDIYFEYDKTNIKEGDKPTLEGIAGWMKENGIKHVMIEGHCDERGSKEYNLALGEQRALSARRYIVNCGVEPKRVHTISYGEEKPIDPGHNETAWANNRRGHFLISQ